MARIEYVRFPDFRPQVTGDLTTLSWCIRKNSKTSRLPQLFWSDSSPWREANLWILQRTRSAWGVESAYSNLTHLLFYAKWLEEREVSWLHFPDREDERCLTMFRGELIRKRGLGELHASTTSARMASVVRFYRWAYDEGLIQAGTPLWKDTIHRISIDHAYGITRSLEVASTNLTIPNRKANIGAPEGGLLPVSRGAWSSILSFSEEHAPQELTLLLRLGFSTGMRIGTLLSLRVATIERAYPHPSFKGWYAISIGPSAKPPVATKFNKDGQAMVPAHALQALRAYVNSPRHLLRSARANPADRDLVFLSRYGKQYGNKREESSAVNTHISRLRETARRHGHHYLEGFKFHRTRATFGTELARVAIKHGGLSFAIWMVKVALMHEREEDTLRYIRFVQSNEVLEEASTAFTREFFGIIEEATKEHRGLSCTP